MHKKCPLFYRKAGLKRIVGKGESQAKKRFAYFDRRMMCAAWVPHLREMSAKLTEGVIQRYSARTNFLNASIERMTFSVSVQNAMRK